MRKNNGTIALWVSSYLFNLNNFSYYEKLFIMITECIIFYVICLVIRKLFIQYVTKIKQLFIKEVKA